MRVKRLAFGIFLFPTILGAFAAESEITDSFSSTFETKKWNAVSQVVQDTYEITG